MAPLFRREASPRLVKIGSLAGLGVLQNGTFSPRAVFRART
jgi:hypothetical protein